MLKSLSPGEDSNSTSSFSHVDQSDIELKAKILSHEMNPK